eukprot:44557-Lingulodinium_polyedra.AAC.1
MVHVATLVLSDPDVVRKGWIIDRLSSGIRQWHSDQLTHNTSPASNQAFYTRQAGGDFWQSLRWPFEVASTAAELKKLQFVLKCPDSVARCLSTDHPLVLVGNQWAAL